MHLSYVAPVVMNGEKVVELNKEEVEKAKYEWKHALILLCGWGLTNHSSTRFNSWSMNSLSRIGSGLGLPLYADESTIKMDRISFARVLIEIDIARELPKKVRVKDPNKLAAMLRENTVTLQQCRNDILRDDQDEQQSDRTW
ncbi:hypothetical protein H5410_013053 [Solanum commersonii]|uniref:Uncharacterized protein n=1 Tax=Solanum commersonii TaxID=4109 RepID=A0A9J6AU81_SOLCO|nr:hypothetical protein H5410_013053 [Solanum commersonii]